MSSTVTVTGTAGPGLTITAAVFTNVTSFTFDTTNEMLFLVSNSRNIEVSIAAATTITVTVSGNSYTVTIT